MRQCLAILIGLLAWAGCNNTPGNSGEAEQSSSAAAEQMEAYELKTIPGSSMQEAYAYNQQGEITEEGFFLDGYKTGIWISYHPGGEYPAKMVTYVGGNYHGPYFEFNERGQIQLKAHYRNNKLDGDWSAYRLGRPLKKAEYKEGELHGLYQEFEFTTGVLKKEADYKEGKQHGTLRFFDEKGEVTTEFEYRDGKKVGGGILE